MTEFNTNGGAYLVQNSGALAQTFLALQRRATAEGRGEEVLQAAKSILRRLRANPLAVGEPLYVLPALQMQVRVVVVRPLYVEFGVCEDRLLVFVKSVKLLSVRSG